MTTENNLNFLKERIFDIKSALLYNMSDHLVKIPASIISILKVDEEGQLWFFVHKPSQLLFDKEKVFPVRLQFYRKGKPFYMHVAGVACIDECKDEIHGLAGLDREVENKAMQDMVLIKLKMSKAEYYEQKPQTDNQNIIRYLFQNIYTSLFKSAGYYRPFELNTNAA